MLRPAYAVAAVCGLPKVGLTCGDWQMSLPCHADDLSWVQEALKKRSTHVTARDMTAQVEAEEAIIDSAAKYVAVDREAFFRT
jgi:hypothetical protein